MVCVGRLSGIPIVGASGCCSSSSSSLDARGSWKSLPPNYCSTKTITPRSSSTSGLQQQSVRTLILCEAAAGGGAAGGNHGAAMSSNSNGSGRAVNGEKQRRRLEDTLLYRGKEVPEEMIEKPTGVPSEPLAIGNKPGCGNCDARGAVECPTCSGSGLYVDSIMESQGIIVKLKCLGCGGTGSTLCPDCGGRGHS